MRQIILAVCIGTSTLLGFGQAPVKPSGPAKATEQAKSPAEQVKPEDKCKVSGQVLSVTTGEGLRRANLSLEDPSGSPKFTAITDTEGKFEISDVPPGRYLLYAEKTGFMRQSYGARASGLGSTMLTLEKRQELKGLSFKLTPQGIIAGRVLDDEGEPVAATIVMAVHYTYQQGRRTLMPAEAMNTNPMTNDQGEFRIANLPPGKYYVMATRMKMPTDEAPPPAAPGKPEEGYVTTYFPNATEANSASAIDVAPGAEVRGMDVRLRKAKTFRVRGKILDTAGQPVGANTVLSMARRDDPSAMPFVGSMAMVKDGKFEMTDVAPGQYFVTVIQTGGGGGPVISRYPLNVAEKDLDGVAINLTTGFEVTATLTLGGEATGAAGKLRSLHPMLMAIEGMPLMPGVGQWKDDGTIQFKNVLPDRYRLELGALPNGLYVKSIRAGTSDATDSPIDLTKGVPGPIEVVLATGGGSISGTVRNSKGDPAPGAMVTLVPKNPPAVRRDLAKRGFTDQNGAYQLRGIVPGEYRLIAWEEVEPGAAEDPEFRRPFERYAIDAKVEAGASLTQALEMVPRTALEIEKAKQ